MKRYSPSFALVAAFACGPSAVSTQPDKAVDAGERDDLPDGSAAECVAGDSRCNGTQLESCAASGFYVATADRDGRCGGCDLDEASYIGCRYLPTITQNLIDSETFSFAITVSNSGTARAFIEITGGALTAPIDFSVAAGSVHTETLPWHQTLLTQFTSYVAGGAYQLNSDQPVTVYQFSPLDYTRDGKFSYSNDASLLFPENTLGEKYFVATYPGGGFTITAIEDAVVTITPAADLPANYGLPGMPAGEPSTMTMARGDVLSLRSLGDLSGTQIESSTPVQVLGFHFCTYVPEDVPFCDHLEASMVPFHALGSDYLITAPVRPRPDNANFLEDRIIRLIAAEDDTTLTYDPPLPDAPTSIDTAGTVIEFPPTAGSLRIQSDKKLLVAELMVGQTWNEGTSGDPALTVAVPVEQYRRYYLFHAPTNYETNYVNIVAPTGTLVTLNGAEVPGFQPIGTSGFSVARVLLSNQGTGDHVIVADAPVGISVYGYGQYTSYWYPGGLNLDPIVID